MEILDGHFRDSRARRTCQRRYEAVQLAVELNFLINLPAVGFERGSEVVQIDSRKLCHHPVSGTAGKLPHQPVIPPLVAPATYQVVALFYFFEEARNFFRVVMPVAVPRNDAFPPRTITP